jgi:hypothetical protein
MRSAQSLVADDLHDLLMTSSSAHRGTGLAKPGAVESGVNLKGKLLSTKLMRLC